jgi:hypothetical protein
MSTLHEDQYIFLIYLAQFLELDVFQTKVVEKIKTHILCSRTFFFVKNFVVYEIMLKTATKLRLLASRVWPTVCLSVCLSVPV